MLSACATLCTTENGTWMEDVCKVMREGQGLRIFQNEVLQRIFGSKKDKVNLGMEKVRNLYWFIDEVNQSDINGTYNTHERC